MTESGIGRETERVEFSSAVFSHNYSKTDTKWTSWLAGKTWILQWFSLSVTHHIEKQVVSFLLWNKSVSQAILLEMFVRHTREEQKKLWMQFILHCIFSFLVCFLCGGCDLKKIFLKEIGKKKPTQRGSQDLFPVVIELT